jgi:multiple sugar transport system permease protein
MAGPVTAVPEAGVSGKELVSRPRSRWRSRCVREALLAYAYLTPALLVLMLFSLGPFVYVFYASTLHTPGAATQHFVGLDNYRYLLDPAQDSGFWQALATTF